MKHLAYEHRPMTPIVAETFRRIHGMLPGRLRPPCGVAGRTPWKRRLLVAIGWLIALIVQAALILVVKEVIELCHGVIGLYLDLAKIQLDLSSQYVAVTSP